MGRRCLTVSFLSQKTEEVSDFVNSGHGYFSFEEQNIFIGMLKPRDAETSLPRSIFSRSGALQTIPFRMPTLMLKIFQKAPFKICLCKTRIEVFQNKMYKNSAIFCGGSENTHRQITASSKIVSKATASECLRMISKNCRCWRKNGCEGSGDISK